MLHCNGLEALIVFVYFHLLTDAHEWLLGEDVDILPHLLLPLAGPEEFDEEDMDKLPPDLQYLEETKKREEDADIRQMLLEALLQVGTEAIEWYEIMGFVQLF